MSHIEIFGPPGAGKSTVFSRLITFDYIYGGVEDDAIRRLFMEKSSPKHKIIYKFLPPAICDRLEDEFFKYRFSYNTLENFINEHPRFISTISDAMDAVSYEPEEVFYSCRRSVERYQLGASTVSHDEILCLDESFAQRAFMILWRDPDESFKLYDYFKNVPTPALVVHVDAPTELCLERQRERERITVAKDWESNDLKNVQRKTQKICSNICDHLSEETSVVTIENTGTVEKTVEEILEVSNGKVGNRSGVRKLRL